MKKLSADPQNVVFALVRNPEKSPELQAFLESEGNGNNNIHVVQMDLMDSVSIQVNLRLAV